MKAFELDFDYELDSDEGYKESRPKEKSGLGGSISKVEGKKVDSCDTNLSFSVTKIQISQDFPGNPVIRTQRSQCRPGQGFNAWSGN